MNAGVRPRGRSIIFVLAAISAMGSMATHMVVPALPGMASDLGIGVIAAQKVISFYLFGLAGGQLLVGPLVDSFGRRPVLIGGLAVFTAASLMLAFSNSEIPLLAGRVLEAAGAAAGLVTARVMVGDLFDREEAGRRQANLMSVVLLSPAIAPVIGGFIAGHFGWRPIFALLALVGLAALVFTLMHIGESRPDGAHPHEGKSLAQRYLLLSRNPRFLRTVTAIAGQSTALYMFLALAPFLLIDQWGLSEEAAGVCFLVVAAGGMAGTFLVGFFEKRGNPLRTGIGIGLVGSCIALVFASGIAGPAAWPMLIAPMLLMALGAGIGGPAGFASIVHVEEGLSGTAVSLAGAIQMLSSGSGALVLGLLGPPSFGLLGWGLLAVSLIAFVAVPSPVKPYS